MNLPVKRKFHDTMGETSSILSCDKHLRGISNPGWSVKTSSSDWVMLLDHVNATLANAECSCAAFLLALISNVAYQPQFGCEDDTDAALHVAAANKLHFIHHHRYMRL